MRLSNALSKKRVTQASLLMAMLMGAGSAQANDPKFIYQLSVDGKAKVPEWLLINNIYGSWFNVGGNHSCGLWTPPEGTITWGEGFQQSRVCNQNQERDVTPVLMNPVLNTTKQGDVYQDGQVINVTQYNPSIGTLDYVIGERAADWGTWIDAGGNYACDDWTPSTETVNLFENFTQNRDCSQNQTRSRQVFNVWASGEETPKRVDPGSQTITEEQLQVVQGTRDFIDGQSIKPWSPWLDTGTFYDCAVWSPSMGAINLDQPFSQDRTCSQDQSSERDIYDVWASGKETFASKGNREQTIDVEQVQSNVGSKDFITSSRNGDYTSWSASAPARNCSAWTPNDSTVNLDDDYTQTRTCQQDQNRTRIVYDVWQSGLETENRTEVDNQVIDVDQSQAAVGARDYILSQEALEWNVWSNTATPYACGSWGVVPTDETEEYTQSRICSQDQLRTRTINDVWQSGQRTFNSTETGNGTIDVTQLRDVTVGHSSWVDSGAQYNCATWAPQAQNQTTNFTQSEVCEQDQVRNRIYSASGSNIGSVPEARTVNETNARLVSVSADSWSDTNRTAYSAWGPSPTAQTTTFTQSRNYTQNRVRSWTYNAEGAEIHNREQTGSVVEQVESRSVSVNFSNWLDQGGQYDCGAWLPGVSAQTNNFDQSQSCSQDQTRNRVYITDTTTLNSVVENNTVVTINDRSMDVNVGGWSDTTRESHSAWLPTPTTEVVDFSQNRSFTQNQTRTWTYSAPSEATVSRIENGALSSQPQSRLVNVVFGDWGSTGTRVCEAWGADPASIDLNEDFTQTRSCQQPQERDRNYVVAGSEISTVKEERVTPVTESRAATGTQDFIVTTANEAWSAWSNTGGLYDCGTWGAAPIAQTSDYTQSRTCQQNQERSRDIMNVWESGRKTLNNTEAGDQAIDVGQNRGVSISYSDWTNSGSQFSCGNWGPETTTQTTDFTQNQICSQGQVRNRIYSVGSSVIGTTNNAESQNVSVTNSRTVSVLAGGWSNTTTSNFGSWTLAPSTQTANFTQTRSYRQNRERTWTYSDGNSRVETGYTNQSQNRTVSISYSAWTNSGGQSACGAWSPVTNTQTANFTQTQNCSQGQVRDRIYSVGSTEINTVSNASSQTVSVTNSRTVSVSVSDWLNVNNSNFGAWTAAAGSQTSNFTQTRAYRTNRTRTWTYSDGNSRVETGYVNRSQDRDVTISYSPWTNSGDQFSCGAWSPTPTSQTANFTQTQDCSQGQVRNRIYSVGSTAINTVTDANSQNINVTNSRTVNVSVGSWSNTTTSNFGSWTPNPTTQTADFPQTRSYRQNRQRTWSYSDGTSRVETGYTNQSQSRTVSISYSAWTNSGGQSACGAWSPATNTQTENFTQTQSCSQGQVRNRIYKVGSTVLSTASNASSQTVSVTNSRTVNVSAGSWSNTSTSNFGSWTPNPTTQAADFTQTRNYRQNRQRTWSYSDGNTRTETGYTNQSQNRTVSISYSPWENSGNQFSCGAWGPTPTSQISSFTQTQSCSQKQVRDRIYSVDSSVIATTSDASSQTVSVINSRNVSVSVSSWSNVNNSNFGSWTAAAGSQTSNFTQNRAYRTNRTRTWTYSDGNSRVETGYVNRSQDRDVTISYSPWKNSGNQFSCGAWGPTPTSQTANFTQTQDCSQGQVRDRIYSVGSSVIATTSNANSQNINVTNSRTVNVSVGSWSNTSTSNFGSWTPNPTTQSADFTQTRSYRQNRQRTWNYSDGTNRVETGYTNQSQNRIVSISYSAWTNSGGQFACGAWSPATNTQTENFTQTQSCSQGQVRNRIYSVGSTVISTASNASSQTVSVTNSRTVSVSAGGWSNTSTSNFGSWTPNPTTQTSNYTQTRSYHQNRERIWTYSDNNTRTETGYTNQSQSRTVSISYSAWKNSGGQSACGAWSPATNAQTANFTQNQSCSQGQVRDRIYSVGSTVIGTDSNASSQTVSVTNSRTVSVSVSSWSNVNNSNFGSWTAAAGSQTSNFTQNRAYRTNRTRTWTYSDGNSRVETGYVNRSQDRDVTISYSPWTNSGNQFSCGAWGPTPTSQTANFTQTQDCSQKQVRNRIYKVGSSVIATTSNANAKNINVTNSRTVNVSVGGWSNTSTSNFGSWTPNPTTQTAGFPQTRSYRQNRQRTWSYSDGTSRVETGYTNQSQNRTVSVSYSGWSNSGNQFSCGAWGPTPTSQTSSFTQTQSCSQKQLRNRIYKVGSTVIGTTNNASSQNVSVTNSRTVSVSVSSWSNVNNSNFGSWTAAAGSQTSNFTQNRAYRTNRTRTWTYSDGNRRVETGYVNRSQSRSVTISYSGWANSGNQFSCGAWGPTPTSQTANFTQTQSCSQKQVRNRIYKVGSSVIATTNNANSQNINVTNSRTVSVSVSSWSNVNNSNFGSWTAAAGSQTSNFTQNRAYRTNRTRTWTYSDGTSRVETGYTNQSQNRTVSVSYSGWSNSGNQFSCGAWGPTPTSQTSSFTQTQSCSQKQLRNRIYKVGSSVIATTNNANSQNINVTNSRTVNVSAGGWSNTNTSNYGSWTPNPTSQTSNYTQTRSYRQNRQRTWNYSDGTNRVETGYTNQSQNRTVSVSYSGWSNSGGQFSCGSWGPNASSQTSNFTQTQSCSQKQLRNRVYKVGSTVIGTTNNANSQTISVSNSRTVSVSLGSWATTNRTNYGSWTPSPTTQTSNFTQTRSYTQNFARTWTYSAGGSTLSSRVQTTSSNESQSNTISVSVGGWSNVNNSNFGSWTPNPTSQTSNFTQTRAYRTNRTRTWTYSDGSSRAETGYINQSQSRTVSVSWSGWSNYQGVSNCSSWSPATNTRQQGVRFTQERYCDQGRVRTRSYSSGQSASEYVTIRVRQTQSAFGTDIGVTGQSTGAWRNTGGIYSCSTYSPTSSQVNWGQNYTGTRTCSQNQYRDVVSTISYADGSKRQSTARQTQVAKPTSTTSMVGTRNYVLRTETVFSHYSYGSNFNCGTWSPAVSSVNDGVSFQQSRSCTRYRYRYNDTYTVYASGYRPMTTSNQYAGRTTQTPSYTQYATGTKQTLKWVSQGGTTCTSRPNIIRGGDLSFGKPCTSEGAYIRESEGEQCWGGGYMTWVFRCTRL
jgi:hypothetical protein